MSDRLCAYVRRLRTAPNGEPISGSEAHALLLLASMANDWTGEARVAVELLADDMRLSERRVQQLLTSLIRKGVVERVGHSGGGRTKSGEGIPNRYRIRVAAEAEAAAQPADAPDKGEAHFTLEDAARVQPISPLPDKGEMSAAPRVKSVAAKGEMGFTHKSTDQDDQDAKDGSPSGPLAVAPASGQTVAEQLETALAALTAPGANAPAIAARFYRTLYPLRPGQTVGQLCGRLGVLARQSGGYGPLMERLTELIGRRLSGDPLDYLTAVGQKRLTHKPQRPPPPPAAASGGQTAGILHYRTGFGPPRSAKAARET